MRARPPRTLFVGFWRDIGRLGTPTRTLLMVMMLFCCLPSSLLAFLTLPVSRHKTTQVEGWQVFSGKGSNQLGPWIERSCICCSIYSYCSICCSNRRRSLLGKFAFGSIATIASSSVATATAEARQDFASSLPPLLDDKKSLLLSQRFEESILQQPAPTAVPEELNGVDNFFYPSFMAGTWNVTQTLVNVSTPLGLVFLGGPNGVLSIAEKTLAESQSRLQDPIPLQLRYVPTKWGVAEDRLFNTRQRLNAFAGRTVVSTIAYADVGACNRAKVLSLGGTPEDPLQTTFVQFKGPAAQKNFVTAHRSDDLDTLPSWTGFELQRSIFALTNENTAPPIFTDTEYLWQFTSQRPGETSSINNSRRPLVVEGRLRIASYLNAQQDKLYFEARNRAVSLLDYRLDMIRIE